jgi:hypothetical protein
MKYYFLLDGFVEPKEIDEEFFNWLRESHPDILPCIVALIKVKLK